MWRATKTTYGNAYNDAMKEIKDISEASYD